MVQVDWLNIYKAWIGIESKGEWEVRFCNVASPASASVMKCDGET